MEVREFPDFFVVGLSHLFSKMSLKENLCAARLLTQFVWYCTDMKKFSEKPGFKSLALGGFAIPCKPKKSTKFEIYSCPHLKLTLFLLLLVQKKN